MNCVVILLGTTLQFAANLTLNSDPDRFPPAIIMMTMMMMMQSTARVSQFGWLHRFSLQRWINLTM